MSSAGLWNVSKSAPVAHCPSTYGVITLSHSWQHLRVTSLQLTGVTGHRRQLCSSDHAQVYLLSQWEVTGFRPHITAVRWVRCAEPQTELLLLNLTLHQSPLQPVPHYSPSKTHDAATKYSTFDSLWYDYYHVLFDVNSISMIQSLT